MAVARAEGHSSEASHPLPQPEFWGPTCACLSWLCVRCVVRRGSAVRSLAPSPALDVVAVGLADGRAVLHNVRTDEEVGGGGGDEGLVGGTTHGGGK